MSEPRHDETTRKAADALGREARAAADELAREVRAATEELGREVRAAADEWRRETAPVAGELRVELGTAGREVMTALREAMEEARRAMRESRRVAREATAAAGGTAADTPQPRTSRAQRKELTRELLLDAAAEVFAEKGFHGASLDDVADAAGFTKGAVYSNFATKSELFLALLDRHKRERSEVLVRGMAAVSVDQLPDLAVSWLRSQGEEDRDWNVLAVEFWLAAMRDPEVRQRLMAGRDEAYDELAATLGAKLVAAGRDPGIPPRDLIALLDAVGSGLLMNGYLDGAIDGPRLFAVAVRRLLADPGRAGESR